MHEELFLPDPERLHLDHVSWDPPGITFFFTTSQTTNCCPRCGQASARVHSHYARQLADLPLAGYQVRLHWQVRRFFCQNRDCPKVTFAEQIPAIHRYARKTNRLAAQQTEIAFVAGGEAGARLAALLQVPTSPDTLLRLIRKAPLFVPASPQLIGVDDWAVRKRQSYGTILVDLDTHHPVDLLPERSAEVLSTWLQAHPGVQVISRDRSREYAQGATDGAPEAIQVADRYHLLVNLREAVERFLEQHRKCLVAAAEAQIQPSPASRGETAPVPNLDAGTAVPQEEPRPVTKAEQAKALHRDKRLRRYQDVLSLHQQGVGIRAIARQLGMTRDTVRKYLRAGEFPERAQRRKRRTQISPYEGYLQARWQAGCQNRLQLWREIGEQGFTGAHTLVYLWAKQKGLKKETASKATQKPKIQSPIPKKASPWSAPRAAWLLFQSEQDQKHEDRLALEAMKAVEPKVAQVQNFVREFQGMVRHRQGEKLPDWLQQVAASRIEALVGFERGLQADRKAVEAALRLPWSNGVTEGNINRLKMIKRQMYGRANFDLLRQRVLRLPLGT